MKYIDAGLLRKEIEKWKSLFSKEKEKKDASKTDKLSLGGRIAMLEEILVLIDSLRQEQQEATSIKGYLSRDIGGQLIISLSPNYMDDEWMLLESKLFPKIKSGNAPRCVNIIIKEIK